MKRTTILSAIIMGISLAMAPASSQAQSAVSHRGDHYDQYGHYDPHQQKQDDEFRMTHLEAFAGDLIGLTLPRWVIETQLKNGTWEPAEHGMVSIKDHSGTHANVRLLASGTTVVNYRYRYIKEGREETAYYPFTIHIRRVNPEVATLPSTLYLDWDEPLQVNNQVRLQPQYSECTMEFSVDDPTIVDVIYDNNDNCRLIGRRLGETYVTLHTGNALVTRARVIVQIPEVRSIDIKAGNKTLRPGEKMQLDAQLSPARAEARLTWTSDNPSIVSVNEYGRITAHAEGKATIRVTSDNGKKDSITIKVKR